MEVTPEPPPDISERSPISLRTHARARWGADAGYPERDAGSICSRVFLLLNVCRQHCSHRKRRSCTCRIWNSPFANVRTICGSLMVVTMDGPTHTGWLHNAKSWRDLLEVSPV